MTTTPAMPDLTAVIKWLENGCDPREAVKELKHHQSKLQALATLQAQPAEVSDAEIVATLEAAGVKFQRFMGGITGTKDCWSTAGSQDVRKLLAGVRAILALRPQSESEARRAAQEQLYTERERHTAEVKRLQTEIGRLQSERPQAVPMTEQWRLLRSGERIEAGDEGLQDDCETWLPLAGWEVGMTYNPTALVPMRRRVPSITAPAGGEVDRG